jgi:hypothetical protein
MAKYNYFGLEAYDLDRSERPYYCEFAVQNRETGEWIVDFYTNKSLEGMFIEIADGTHRQIRGTCQFSMPSSKQGARRLLRQMAEEV